MISAILDTIMTAGKLDEEKMAMYVAKRVSVMLFKTETLYYVFMDEARERVKSVIEAGELNG